MPVPEPPPDTSTDTAGATFAYSSAHAWARLTMVSEPVFWITVFSGCSTLTASSRASHATARDQDQADDRRRAEPD